MVLEILSAQGEAVRRFFEVSPAHIVLRTLQALADDGLLSATTVVAARERLGLGPSPAPWTL